ncbi:MAG: four helix bundle protein [Bacteroidales bacterium]|jgi:four helix bundle protein|nr:four helix bundle protein [Bacteroidales bacterium]HOI33263.1 four helix bundle protein [Bacteroidales bacterium]
MAKHKEHEIWQLPLDFVVDTYNITTIFSDEGKYGLISQLCCSACSIPSHNAEGSARNSDQQYLNSAFGSLSTLETHHNCQTIKLFENKSNRRILVCDKN